MIAELEEYMETPLEVVQRAFERSEARARTGESPAKTKERLEKLKESLAEKQEEEGDADKQAAWGHIMKIVKAHLAHLQEEEDAERGLNTAYDAIPDNKVNKEILKKHFKKIEKAYKDAEELTQNLETPRQTIERLKAFKLHIEQKKLEGLSANKEKALDRLSKVTTEYLDGKRNEILINILINIESLPLNEDYFRSSEENIQRDEGPEETVKRLGKLKSQIIKEMNKEDPLNNQKKNWGRAIAITDEYISGKLWDRVTSVFDEMAADELEETPLSSSVSKIKKAFKVYEENVEKLETPKGSIERLQKIKTSLSEGNLEEATENERKALARLGNLIEGSINEKTREKLDNRLDNNYLAIPDSEVNEDILEPYLLKIEETYKKIVKNIKTSGKSGKVLKQLRQAKDHADEEIASGENSENKKAAWRRVRTVAEGEIRSLEEEAGSGDNIELIQEEYKKLLELGRAAATLDESTSLKPRIEVREKAFKELLTSLKPTLEKMEDSKFEIEKLMSKASGDEKKILSHMLNILGNQIEFKKIENDINALADLSEVDFNNAEEKSSYLENIEQQARQYERHLQISEEPEDSVKRIRNAQHQLEEEEAAEEDPKTKEVMGRVLKVMKENITSLKGKGKDKQPIDNDDAEVKAGGGTPEVPKPVVLAPEAPPPPPSTPTSVPGGDEAIPVVKKSEKSFADQLKEKKETLGSPEVPEAPPPPPAGIQDTFSSVLGEKVVKSINAAKEIALAREQALEEEKKLAKQPQQTSKEEKENTKEGVEEEKILTMAKGIIGKKKIEDTVIKIKRIEEAKLKAKTAEEALDEAVEASKAAKAAVKKALDAEEQALVVEKERVEEREEAAKEKKRKAEANSNALRARGEQRNTSSETEAENALEAAEKAKEEAEKAYNTALLNALDAAQQAERAKEEVNQAKKIEIEAKAKKERARVEADSIVANAKKIEDLAASLEREGKDLIEIARAEIAGEVLFKAKLAVVEAEKEVAVAEKAAVDAAKAAQEAAAAEAEDDWDEEDIISAAADAEAHAKKADDEAKRKVTAAIEAKRKVEAAEEVAEEAANAAIDIAKRIAAQKTPKEGEQEDLIPSSGGVHSAPPPPPPPASGDPEPIDDIRRDTPPPPPPPTRATTATTETLGDALQRAIAARAGTGRLSPPPSTPDPQDETLDQTLKRRLASKSTKPKKSDEEIAAKKEYKRTKADTSEDDWLE